MNYCMDNFMNNNEFGMFFTSAYFIFVLLLLVLQIVGMWKLFEKANYAGWKSLIPFYNAYILFEIAWGNGWIFLTMFIPVVNIIVAIMFALKLGESFEKSTLFKVGLILIPSIFTLILGFDNSSYMGPA